MILTLSTTVYSPDFGYTQKPSRLVSDVIVVGSTNKTKSLQFCKIWTRGTLSLHSNKTHGTKLLIRERRKRIVATKISDNQDFNQSGVQEDLNGLDDLQLPLESNSNSKPAARSFLPSALHNVGEWVNGKYKIVDTLGQGGSGTTYLAVTETGETVAIKAVSLRAMKQWKQLDLFQREARVLRSLKHPGIPEYIDDFEVDTENDRYFYIVQKEASGKSFADLVADGWRVSEEEVVAIAIKILNILKYLETLRPPVVHRDIKPDNIIYDLSTGEVKLVDFGAVQESSPLTMVASTVVGTYGYMAPEQFQNRASPQSDLYSLGATLLFLLSGRPPSSFPQKRLRVNFRESVNVGGQLAQVLEQLLEPATEDRFKSAEEVMSALLRKPLDFITDIRKKQQMGGSVFPGQRIDRSAQRPSGTNVDIKRSNTNLSIRIPPGGITAETIGTGSFAVAWNSFILFWTASAAAARAPLFFTAFSIPFWIAGAGLMWSVVNHAAVSVDLSFEKSGFDDKFKIEWRLGKIWKHIVEGKCKDINEVRLVTQKVENERPVVACEIVEGVKTHVFGGSLSPIEKKWIASEVMHFLEE